IQDVWIAPSRLVGQGGSAQDLMYGTTLRVYDSESDLWSITWIDPVTKSFNRMTGRKVGDDIVQEYCTEEQVLSQWRFTEITANSFHWIYRDSRDRGETWKVRVEFFLQRRAPESSKGA